MTDTKQTKSTDAEDCCGGNFGGMMDMLKTMMGGKEGSFDCSAMMKKCCGGEDGKFDCADMMKNMCGGSAEASHQE